MNKPIFCIVGESGCGKSTYLDLILNSNRYDYNLKELKYCTTRRKRYSEENDYYFMSNDEYLKIKSINPDNIVEYRHYNKYDEDVYYFTLRKNLECEGYDALICAASVDQALSYMKALDDVYIIDIKVELKERIKRLLNRANTNNEVLEICRRTVEEQDEYRRLDSVNKNIMHIYNDNSKFKYEYSADMLYAVITSSNLNTIEKYIYDHIKK